MTPPRRHRRPTPATSASNLLATVGLTVLTAVSALSLHRIFRGDRWIAPVLIMAVVVHAGTCALRQANRTGLGGFLVILAAIPVLAVWLVLPATLHHGLPLSATWHAFGTDLRRAASAVPGTSAPTALIPGFDLAATMAVGLVAFIADWAAFRLGSALQALVPPLALFTFAAAFGVSKGRTLAVGAELAAALLFVALHDRSRSDPRAGPLGRGSSGGRIAGVAIAGAAIVAATVAAPLLPGYGSGAAAAWRGAGPKESTNRVTISPLVDIRTRLLDQTGAEVFTVRSAQAAYWRLTSLDTFDGQVWKSDDTYKQVGSRLPGADTLGSATATSETFHIEALASIWLPTGLDPQRIEGKAAVSYDAKSASLISAQPTTDGLTYTVQAAGNVGALSAQVLERAAPLTPRTDPNDVRLPAIPDRVRALAHSIVAGQTTEYAKALALEDYFHRSPFVYDTAVTGGHDIDALEDFLFVTHHGYCEQYAGTFGVLARAVGLPVRIAVGFTPGRQDAAGVFHVVDNDAHAWPEVLFPGIGWVPFEPTPGRTIPGAGYTGMATAATPAPTPAPGTTAPQAGVAGTTGPAAVAGTVPAPPSAQGDAPVGSARHGAHRSPSWGHDAALALVTGVLALVLVVGVMAGAALYRRRHAPIRSSAQPSPALPVWDDIVLLLAGQGINRAPDETNIEFARRAGAPSPELAAHLVALAHYASAAEFSRQPRGDIDQAATDLATSIRQLLEPRTPAGARRH